MGSFGAPTPKATVVCANRPWVIQILEHTLNVGARASNALVDRWTDTGGKRRFRGSPELKASQASLQYFNMYFATSGGQQHSLVANNYTFASM
jgi:hypothetical protein